MRISGATTARLGRGVHGLRSSGGTAGQSSQPVRGCARAASTICPRERVRIRPSGPAHRAPTSRASSSSKSKMRAFSRDPLGRCGLRDHRVAALNAPSQEDLRGGLPAAARHFAYDGVIEVLAMGQGAVRLHRHTQPAAGLDERSPVMKRAELDLVDRGRVAPRLAHRLELSGIEVADADGAGQAALEGTLHAGPRPCRAAQRPMDQIEVQALDSQPLEAPQRLRPRRHAPRG